MLPFLFVVEWHIVCSFILSWIHILTIFCSFLFTSAHFSQTLICFLTFISSGFCIRSYFISSILPWCYLLFLFHYSESYICYTCLSSLTASHGMISFLVVTSASLKMSHFELLTKRFNATEYIIKMRNKGFISTFSTCALFFNKPLGIPRKGRKKTLWIYLFPQIPKNGQKEIISF